MNPRFLLPAVLLCVAAAPAATPSHQETYDQRMARVKAMFVGQPACDVADRKACTKSCTAATFKAYRYDTSGAADCEVMGDIWSQGLADVKKPMVDVGYKSYSSACFMGQATACEKEATYLDSIGAADKAIEVRTAACQKGYMPACLTAATSIGKADPAKAVKLAVMGHVHSCDTLRVADSCTWLEGQVDLAAARRAELEAERQQDVALITSSSGTIKVSVVTNVEPLLETHQLVYVIHPFEQDAVTDELRDTLCYEVWVPTASDAKLALVAAAADSIARRKIEVDPRLIVRTPFSPRHPKSKCRGDLIQLAVD